MNVHDRHVILHCSLIDGVGPATVASLGAALGRNSWNDLYRWSVADIRIRARLSERVAQLVHDGLADPALLEKERGLLERHALSWCTIFDDEYPRLLKEIHVPPAILYWRGAPLKVDGRDVALVGSRKANQYGRNVIDTLVPPLVRSGWAIVSGGALGADTMAHEAALRAQGITVAVIGSGLLKPYPATNRALFDSIAAHGGTVVSPFPLLMEAMPGNFPARNRIIAGLSRATVVVQASEKSGARITALQALEQGRDVGVVPGDIFDPLSAGCHRLLSEGAAPVMSADDVLRMCGGDVVIPSEVERVQEVFAAQPENQPALLNQVDPVVALCGSPQTFDDLLCSLGVTYMQLQERLFALRIQGLVEQDFMGRWSATSRR